ncbi:MAG: AAA family ATPase [Actinomycetota bacterium]
MRPLRLEVQGLTAFRDRQLIDLADLDLFCICGPTGSGKTSLLDAMTYALYGKVERVGNQISQLISQGQPRVAVTLEFEAGDARYRVTRTTMARGSPKVALERLAGGEWRSHADRADRVHDVNRMVADVVGLDYEAFTRSVLLPQGRFAEFLSGDAGERREILTKLLGLGLFEQMARRAREVAAEAKTAGEVTSDLVGREYGDVDEEVVEAAGLEAAALGEQAATMREAEVRVRELTDRWESEGRAVAALEEAVGELQDVVADIGRRAAGLQEAADRFERAESEVALRTAEAEAAKAGHRRAGEALEEAERQWGKREQLTELGHRVGRLADMNVELRAAEAALDAERTAEANSRRVAEKARLIVEEAHAEVDRAAEARVQHEEAHEAAHHRDLVGALIAGLEEGAPCPVCRRTLEMIPEQSPGEIDRARASMLEARRREAGAREALAAADRNLAVSRRDAETAAKEVERLARDVERRRAAFATMAEQVGTAFGGVLPDDPQSEVGRMLEVNEDLSTEERRAAAHREAVVAQLSDAERRAAAAEAEARAAAAGIRALRIDALLDRVRRMEGSDHPTAEPPALPGEPGALLVAVGEVSGQMAETAARLGDSAARRRSARAGLVDKALRVVPRALATAGAHADLRTLAALARQEVGRLEGEEQQARSRRDDLARRLEAKRRLQAEAAAARARQRTYASLAGELQANRLVAYLQAEALTLLAAAGTERLSYLSGGRYRLSFEGDEFYVIDTWNADDRRSVRTLSGGETFLASLSLALALCEEVQSLSVTQKAPLRSLFLDEGFGTLDPETLEMVVSAIEQLGGDGRVVGVITHVRELAERLPVRFEVEKSPRGSQVRRAS